MDIEQEMDRLKGIEEEYNKLIHSHPTLRDQFAMAALNGLMSAKGEFSFVWENAKGEKKLLGYGATPVALDVEGWKIVKTPRQCMAEACYLNADAMLAERSKL